jgi:hypothetical protein
MRNNVNGNQFRDDEIIIMSHIDKETGEYVTTAFPKIGGRLRLAHEENNTISISSDIVRSDDNVAVVRALVTTGKGSSSGLGMASVERDERIAPAILELAETRAIARALRFSGFGVEYCSAEEVSHLNGNGSQDTAATIPSEEPTPHKQANKGNGDVRITDKQLNYILTLGQNQGLDDESLDKESVNIFGVNLAYLSKKDASAFIETLKLKAA